MVAFIESGMYPVCQCKCVTQSILACGSFAGNDRPDFRSGSACLQASLSDTFPERFNILIWNTRYLYCKTGCQCNMAVPVFLRCFRYFGPLCRRYLSVSGDNPAVKQSVPLLCRKPSALTLVMSSGLTVTSLHSASISPSAARKFSSSL